jgi:hypothetical protein
MAGLVLLGAILWAFLLPSDFAFALNCEPQGPHCRSVYNHHVGSRLLIVLAGAFFSAVIWGFSYIARHASGSAEP